MNTKIARSRSGQALIITALIITLLLMSTAYYVLEVETTPIGSQSSRSALPMIQLSSRNAVISALANISNGGLPDVLNADLSKLATALENETYDGQCDMSYELFNSAPYADGSYVSWGTNGFGVSSSTVSFTMNFSGVSSTSESEYETNVTTALTISGVYTSAGSEKYVNVTCTLINDQGPALLQNVTLRYQNVTAGPFMPVDSANNLETVDYGNGTYIMSFIVTAQTFLQVSAQAFDQRGIFVMANVTCIEV